AHRIARDPSVSHDSVAIPSGRHFSRSELDGRENRDPVRQPGKQAALDDDNDDGKREGGVDSCPRASNRLSVPPIVMASVK
ncbi:hypothetical protein GWI33_019926, partial [Rhynchophorus ferrugineus]